MKIQLISKPVVWLLLSALSAASMTYYVTEIWSANQPPGFSDLYAPWWAAHELLLHGRNPYSPAVAHEIQTVIYGAPVTPSANDPSGLAGGFAYPPYAVLLLWPMIYLPFAAAQKVFLFAAVLATLLNLTLWLRALRLRPTAVHWVMLALFVLGSFPALQALKLQNLSLLAAALIAISIFLLSSNRFVLAGIFLAASTFKPQFTVVLIPWLLVWTLADWRARRPLAESFLGTMLLLGLVSEWLVPGWIPGFLHIVSAYRRYTYGHSLLDVWFAPTFGPIASVILVLAALAVGWRHRAELGRVAQIPGGHKHGAGRECGRDSDAGSSCSTLADPWVSLPAARVPVPLAFKFVRANPAGRSLDAVSLALGGGFWPPRGGVLGARGQAESLLGGSALHQSALAPGGFAGRLLLGPGVARTGAVGGWKTSRSRGLAT